MGSLNLGLPINHCGFSSNPGDKTLSKCISRIYLYAQPGMQLELPLISVPECVRADGSSAPKISYSNAFMIYM